MEEIDHVIKLRFMRGGCYVPGSSHEFKNVNDAIKYACYYRFPGSDSYKVICNVTSGEHILDTFLLYEESYNPSETPQDDGIPLTFALALAKVCEEHGVTALYAPDGRGIVASHHWEPWVERLRVRSEGEDGYAANWCECDEVTNIRFGVAL